MWGGVRFINGYSPIRPAGVAREFDSAIHGEISPEKAAALLGNESGPDGLLARLGVDGIIVANEMELGPEPAFEWHVAGATKEGRIFHRWKPLPRIRSMDWIDSRPNERFSAAAVSEISESRNAIAAKVATGDRPALLAISRPFFNGYRATIAGRALPVTSYRGLIPLVEMPPGTSGRLEIVYRPWWLVWGTGMSMVCAGWFMIGSVLALR
jgi:hypothetical protein